MSKPTWKILRLVAVVFAMIGNAGVVLGGETISRKFTVRNTITAPAVAPHEAHARMCTVRNMIVTPAAPLDEAISRAFTARALPTGIEPVPEIPVSLPEAPVSYRLHPSQPNPFNPVTTIRYDLPKTSSVSLRVYDVAGKLVRVLVDRVFQKADWHVASWDGRDDRGHRVASGVYIYELRADSFRDTRRMVLLK